MGMVVDVKDDLYTKGSSWRNFRLSFKDFLFYSINSMRFDEGIVGSIQTNYNSPAGAKLFIFKLHKIYFHPFFISLPLLPKTHPFN
jgi:hypothetical protein